MSMKKAEVYRNEIKSYIVRAGMTMTEVVDYLSDEYGWSASVPNLSGNCGAALYAMVRPWNWLTRWAMTSSGRSVSGKARWPKLIW